MQDAHTLVSARHLLPDRQNYENLPFFSLIIPTYNRRHRLPACLESALQQTFEDIEIILVDDGSTDRTGEWVRDTYKDPRLRYFYKKNEERSIARNYGIARAQGRFVFFLDSDDELLPEHFAVLYENIQKHPDIHRFTTKFKTRSLSGKLLPSRIRHLSEGEYDYRLLLKGNIFNSMLCLRRTEPPIYPFPPQFRIGEDWVFMVGNTYRHPLYLIDKETCISNDHAGRTMRENNRKIVEAKLANAAFLCREFAFSEEEERILRGHAYEFCAVHSYLDYDRREAMHFLRKAVSHLGWNHERQLLALKIQVGKRFIERLQGR